jgi:PAS domain S-box-containing protein
MAVIVVLTSAWTLFFLQHGGKALTLDVVVFALGATAGSAFAWGWRVQALVLAATLGPALLIDARLEQLMAPAQSVIAHGMGIAVSIGLAESAFRRVRAGGLLRAREQEAIRRLAASRDAYRDLAEHARDLIWTIDRERRLQYVNAAAAAFLGRPAAEAIGMPGLGMLTEHPDNDAIPSLIARVFAGEMIPAYIAQVRVAGHPGPRYVEVTTSPAHDEHGRIIGVRGISRDVTQRVEAEAKLRASEARLRRLSESNIVGVILCDTEGVVHEANDAFLTLIGYPATALPLRWDHLTPPEWDPFDQQAVQELAATGVATPWEKEYFHRDGYRVPVLVGVALIEGSARDCIAFVLDLSKRKEAETALRASLEGLRASEDKLRRLARRQTAVREQERKRLGLDLHDDVCQELVGITILLESVRQGLGEDGPAAATLQRAIGYVAEVGDHLRGLAKDLRPLQLQDLGLEGALRSLTEATASGAPRVSVSFPMPVPRLDEDTELAFYRIAQEAIANALRHSGARRVELMLASVDGRLRLEVSDDGCGFEVHRERSAAIGLASMEERALAVGGRLHVWSQPGRGTTIRLDCPLGRLKRASAA